jgi:uncharacterized protein YndB with AHSA1/START domain
MAIASIVDNWATVSHYQFSIDVAAPPAEVFALWTNLDRMDEWVEGVTKVTDVSGPPDQAGSQYTVWFGPIASRTEVIEALPPRLLRTRFESRLLRAQTRVSFAPKGDGTSLTQELWTTGLVSDIFARIFATGSYRGSFRAELNTFARLAEQSARHAGPSARQSDVSHA